MAQHIGDYEAHMRRCKAADARARKQAQCTPLKPISHEEEELALWWYHQQEQMRLEELAEQDD